MKKTRVLIVEDSFVSLKLLRHILQDDSGIEIVGEAENGQLAIDMVKSLKPDVISMDLNMPLMDGIVATQKIMCENPTPIVIVSSFYRPSEIEMAMKVLEAGAVNIMPKPYGPAHEKYAQTAKKYVGMLKSMAEVKVVRRKKVEINPKIIGSTPKNEGGFSTERARYEVVVIGASAGGPQAVKAILSQLPVSFSLPVFIVQHIDTHFAEGYCQWLSGFSALPVKIAGEIEKIERGVVYLPKGDCHLVLKNGGLVSSEAGIPEANLRPAVSVLFRTAATVYGANTVAILLSGMGRDGAEELRLLRNAGAHTIVQSAETSLVWGMPGEAVKLGGAISIMSPDEIVNQLIEIADKTIL